MPKSELEETLLWQIKAEGLPMPEREWRFHPTRKWRFDFSYPDRKIGIEVQGGIYVRGAHSRGTGLERDYEKLNTAQMLGWTVFQFSRKMIENGEATKIIKHFMKEGT